MMANHIYLHKISYLLQEITRQKKVLIRIIHYTVKAKTTNSV